MIFVNIFTYKDDEEIVGYAASSAKLLFKDECEVNIIDDIEHPLSETSIKKLTDFGIFYRTSSFKRNCNLNGKVCCIGILEEIIKSTKGREGYSIKLDSDTLLLNRKLFDEFKNNEYIKYMAPNRPNGIFSGVCYCIKNELLDSMLNNLNLITIDENRAPEDVVIGCLATLTAMPYHCYTIPAYDDTTKNGYSAAWNYKCENHPEIFKQYFNMFSICTVGNYFLDEKLTKKDRIEPMKGIFSILLNNINNNE